MASKFRFRRSFGNVSSRFRGAIPKHFPLFTGLLDDFGGAAAAYSLRALSRGWVAGDVVEVRRSSDSTTQDFTAAQVADGTLTTFTGAGDGFVSIWYDQSGNANNATQAVTTAQPKIVSAGALVVGGLDFDGVDDVLMANDVASYLSGDAIQMSNFSVSNTDVSNVNASLYRLGNSGNSQPLKGWQYRSTAQYGLLYRADDGTSALDLLINSYAINTNYLHSLTVNSSELANGYANGAVLSDLVDHDVNIGAITLDDFSIGSTSFDGQLAELIIYASDQSANRVAIETNINAAYTIF